MSTFSITPEEVEDAYTKLKREAEASGYHLLSDERFGKELVKGILINIKRYGYGACPCRLAAGIEEKDRDIECPCDYRDQDLDEYGQCYCGLYVSDDLLNRLERMGSIPERRGGRKDRRSKIEAESSKLSPQSEKLAYPVWRCSVCGYLCARDVPPLICPICKAKKERFDRFL